MKLVLGRIQFPRCVALISIHGLADLCYNPSKLWIYVLTLALPTCIVTPVFYIASFLHFSADVNCVWSCFVHMGVLLLKTEYATCWLVSSMMCIHIPLLLIQLWRECVLGFVLLFCVGLVALASPWSVLVEILPSSRHGSIILYEFEQKMVIAHVMVNSML